MDYKKSMQIKRTHCMGFTLVETVMVMVILGVLAVGLSAFMKSPVDAYVAAKERNEVANSAHGAISLFSREVRQAIPNSVRVTSSGGRQYLEFVPTVSGGRYRSGPKDGGDVISACEVSDETIIDNSVISFGRPDTCFKTLGLPSQWSDISVGDWVVIGNHGAGYLNADFYASANVTGGNKAKITAISNVGGSAKIQIESHTFQIEGVARRFQIGKSPVTYMCDPTLGVIKRVSNYPISSDQPTSFSGAVEGLVIENLKSCNISYEQGAIGGAFGIVALSISLGSSGDVLDMMVQAHVVNVP